MTKTCNNFNKKYSLEKGDKSKVWFIISMMGPLFVWGWISYFFIQFQTIKMAFQKELPNGLVEWSFDNFTRIFTVGFDTGGIFVESLRNAMLFFGVSFFILPPINIVVAYFLYKKIIGYRFFRITFYLPNILPGMIISILFKYITAPDGSGVIASILYKYGKEMPNIFGDSRYAIWGLLFFSFWNSFGAGFLLYYTAMKRIPPEVIESAELEGINWVQEILYISVPLIWPTYAMTLITMLPTMLYCSGSQLFFTQGNYGTQTLSFWLFLQVKNKSNMNYSTAVSLFFSVITLPIMLLARWLLERVPAIEY